MALSLGSGSPLSVATFTSSLVGMQVASVGREYEGEKTGKFWEALVSVPSAGILHRFFGQDPSGRL